MVAGVPQRFPISLNGKQYLVETKRKQYGRSSIPLRREQFDTSPVVGEGSLSTEDLWPRSVESWHRGAGQEVYDRADADPFRFDDSLGVDPWTKWELSLLGEVEAKANLIQDNARVVAVGDRLYLGRGTTLEYTTDVTGTGLTSFTAVTTTPASDVEGITTDGFNVWAAFGANGIYTTDTSTNAASSYATGTVTIVDYVKGRLMAANNNSIYNVTAAGALPTALLTHANTDFEWVGFAAGLGDIYMAGFSGDKSTIYKTQVKPDGTALDVPTVAGQLPDGEIVRAIDGYLGFIFIGTDQGVRMAKSDPNGDLIFGALIETPGPVRCFEGQKQFVWFGLEDFDVSRWASGTYDGLGRLDLTQEILPNTPAHASDLMVTGSTSTTEQVLSIATFQGVRVFTVADSNEVLARGLYVEKPEKVVSGYVDSGLITYNIPDTKVATYVDLRHEPLTGEVEVFTSADQGSFTTRGSSTTANSTAPSSPFDVGATGTRGEVHELRLKLNRASSVDTTGPTVTRVRLRSEPAPTRGHIFQVPILLYEELVDLNGFTHTLDPADVLNTFESLFDNQILVTYEDRASSKSVFVKDISFEVERPTSDGTFWQGIATITLKIPGK